MVNLAIHNKGQGAASSSSTLKEVKKGLVCFGAGAVANLGNGGWNSLVRDLFQNNAMIRNFYDKGYELPELSYRFAENLANAENKIYSGMYLLDATLLGPIFEELVFRVLLQEYALKKIPEKILKKISPSHVSLIHGKAAKITRVALSALAFSLVHLPSSSASGGKLYGTLFRLIDFFASGLLLGAIQEKTGNPLFNIAAHAGMNAAPSAWLYFTGEY